MFFPASRFMENLKNNLTYYSIKNMTKLFYAISLKEYKKRSLLRRDDKKVVDK